MARETTERSREAGAPTWPGRLAAAVADIGRMPAASATTERMTVGQLRLQLFVTSFVILFFELACIRWVPAHVRLLSYFMNFILLAAFLGIGVGILAGRRERLWLPPVPIMVLVLALALLPLLRPREIWLALPCLLATLFVVYQLGVGSVWSPYYRIQVYPNQLGGYVVNVNNSGHQETMPYLDKETFYFRAYDLLGQRPFKRVLVLGAGTGS